MKKFLVTSIMTLACVSAFAASQNYRIFNVQQSGTPGSGITHLPDGAWDKLFPKKKLDKTQTAKSANTYTAVLPVVGGAGDYIRVNGYHRVTVMNRTNRSQMYNITETLTCNEAKFSDSHWAEVQANSMYNSSDNTFVIVQRANPGWYSCQGTTTVSGESEHASSDTGTLLITCG